MSGPDRVEWAGEMFARYVDLLAEEAVFIGLAAAAGAGAYAVARTLEHRRGGRPASSPWPVRAIVAAALVAGTCLAVGHASVFDDAYISFRYAANLLEGHGLVWNVGERVEGYTNFLWVMILAAATWITGVEMPLVALFGCLLSYVGCVLVFAGVERRLFGGGLPCATVLFALHNTTTEYATTGLETAFATLCTLLGVRSLMSGHARTRAAAAGLWFIAGTLCRPDHGLFWLAGGIAIVSLEPIRPDRASLLSRQRLAGAGAYAATFLPYAAYLVWKLQYYGAILPNTFHAKSAGEAYFNQGGIYALSFLLSAHLWLIAPLALVGFLPRATSPAHRALKVFAVVALPLYNLYVAKVGGDFMVGRFYLVTLPLWLLLARRGLEQLRSARAWKGAVVAGALMATVGGVRLLEQGTNNNSWYIGDESGNHQLRHWFPRVEVKHHNWRGGNNLGRYLQQRGIEPVLATTGIGMIGYYSRLEVVDLRGLTDARVARTELEKRGKPGHEKWPPQSYLDERDVQLVRSSRYHPKRWRKTTEVDIGARKNRNRWHFYRYDVALADRMETLVPEIEFTRFEPVLDRWLAGQRPQKLARIEQDAIFFEQYYFGCNHDPIRQQRLDSVLRNARYVSQGRAPLPVRRPMRPRGPARAPGK